MNTWIAKAFALAFLLMMTSNAGAQLVTFSGTGNLPIPPGAPAQTVGVTTSPCTVTGIGVLGTCVTIDHVEINLLHTFVGDIGILLIGPGGQVLELSTGNGGGGDNYTNTIFSDMAGPFITSGAPPFTGSFRPEGRVTNLNNPYNNGPPLGTFTFANTYNGTNADGVWTLYINDYVVVDIGTLVSWSITFNLGGSAPVANAGPDVNACTGGTTNLTASGGGTYLWSTGDATASIAVMPATTTTYTVTVTEANCGTDTDDVVVTVFPTPTISFSTTDPDLCAGGCQTITATLTGTPPFTLSYNLVASNGASSPFTHTFNSLMETFQACAPANAPPGPIQLLATELQDGHCTCEQ